MDRKIISGPKNNTFPAKSLYAALAIGALLYIIFELPYYCLYISPIIGFSPFPLIFLIYYCLLKAQFTDPGIILRIFNKTIN